MENYFGMSREIVAVVRADRLARADRERRADEAWQGYPRKRGGMLRGWLVRVAAIVTGAGQPRLRAHGIGYPGIPAHPR